MTKACAIVLAGLSLAGCTRSNPASPTSVPSAPTATSVVTPRVTSIAPTEVTQAATEQTVLVFGENFLAGLAASMTTPDGLVIGVETGAINDVLPSQFSLRFRFATAGRYSMRLANATGSLSDAWSFVVAAAPAAVQPVIGRCASPAPLQGYLDPRAPGYVVAFNTGTNVDDAVAALAARYRFTPTHIYRSVLFGFAAQLSAETVEALRCEPVVRYVAYSAVVGVG
ncbi:MAG TPA: protease inhibitor I9 family protein [Vicinamibacterales bacterium]|nr:protease inhibitor I9 family protein [Vicinamibacterales bacterium]